MKPRYSIFFLLFIGITAPELRAQGCSDAGFCSAGSMKSGDDDKSDFTVNIPYALGEQKVSILGMQPELNWKIKENQKLQFKIPFWIIQGDLGSTSGVGDPVLIYTRKLSEKNQWIYSGSAGLKVAVNRANKTSNGMALPMPYQTSLGTHDFIVGFSVRNDDWHFAAGYQQPVIQVNENEFNSDLTLTTNDDLYFNSRHLHRKGDVLLRLERTYAIDKWKFTAGFLPIYHLGRDEIWNQGSKEKVKGSEGLTLNINFSERYQVSKQAYVGMLAAMPLIVRENRPDGLTRAFVVSPHFVWQF